jgi:hypothetical protein
MRKYPRTESLWSFTAILFCMMVLTLAIACGGGGDSGEEAAEPEAMEEAAEPEAMEEAAEEESSDAPRVFFIEPADGATVASPVTFTFGHENYTIEPKGDIHEGAGHHHIAINTECLPPGEAIPEADPWVHFGDGSATIEMQLSAGEQTLTIQIGDGEHVTSDEPGLCQTITITVEEG